MVMPKIDMHHHFYPPDLKDVFGGGPARRWVPQASIDEMDASEIAHVALSASSIPDQWWRQDKNWLRDTVRRFNEYGAEMVKDRPDRFALLAFLSMRDVDGTLAEIDYAFEVLKADGVGIATSFGDKWPGEPEFIPIFEELNRRKALLYVHPTAPFCCTDLIGIRPSLIEYPQDTSRAILSLLFSGTFARYRDIRFVFCHAGGTLPVLASRVEHSAGRAGELSSREAPDGFRAELSRLHYDTALAANRPALGALLDLVPVSQVAFGSDFPYGSIGETLTALRNCGLSSQDLTAIEGENALGLLSRFAMD